ncbi:Protein of unknown function [Gryllus bimaculatus]|nr:Protein of unknown function [Gryllus bimaculatus]
MAEAREDKDMGKSTREELYKVRLEELEKDLDKKNCKINSLKREVKILTDELSRQTEKNQIICEARDENKFKIMELEKEITVLKRENENLQSQLKQEKDIKKYRELSLEAEVALYADQVKKYDQKIKACESKISELKTSPSKAIAEKSSDNNSNNQNIEECHQISQLERDIKLLSLENNDLKCKLGEEREEKKNEMQKLECQFTRCMDKIKEYELREKDYESKICYLQSKLKDIEYQSEERLTEIRKLQEELDIQKNITRNSEEVNKTIANVQRELESLRQIQAETSEKKVMPAMRSVTRSVSKIEQCKHTLITYAEQHRNLQMKFEGELNDQLQEVENILRFDNEENIPNISSTKGALPKAGKSEDLQIQTKQEPKKSPRKSRALQEDENVSSPADPKYVLLV